MPLGFALALARISAPLDPSERARSAHSERGVVEIGPAKHAIESGQSDGAERGVRSASVSLAASQRQMDSRSRCAAFPLQPTDSTPALCPTETGQAAPRQASGGSPRSGRFGGEDSLAKSSRR